MILLFYGDGKGKTLSAIGVAIRLLGYGKRVLFVQFLKKGAGGNFIETSESKILGSLKNLRLIRSGSGRWVVKNPKEVDIQAIDATFETIMKEIINYDAVILDEIVYAVEFNMFELNKLLNFLNKFKNTHHIILTGGRNPPEELVKACDYASQIKKIKHPFDRKIPAIEGIDY